MILNYSQSHTCTVHAGHATHVHGAFTAGALEGKLKGEHVDLAAFTSFMSVFVLLFSGN